MAHRHSTLKKTRQDKKRRLENLKVKLKIKSEIRKFQKTLRENITQAEGLLKKLYSLLDKAAKKGIIHRNAADRKKSRFTHKLRLLKSTSSNESNKPR